MKCRDCSTELVVPDTWSPSLAARPNRICRDCHAAKARARYARNKDRVAQMQRLWGQKNRDRVASYKGFRRQRVRDLAPGADRGAIVAFYRLAKLLEKHNPGARYHVDHIVPLSKGGLHHQDNLQVMRADFNLRKSNKL